MPTTPQWQLLFWHIAPLNILLNSVVSNPYPISQKNCRLRTVIFPTTSDLFLGSSPLIIACVFMVMSYKLRSTAQLRHWYGRVFFHYFRLQKYKRCITPQLQTRCKKITGSH